MTSVEKVKQSNSRPPSNSQETFEQNLSNLDLKLFEKINSQSTDSDKKSLLACQLAVREIKPNYNYLEIGSYLGGSIQTHLLDAKCAKIYSIDKRPKQQPDERGIDYVYQNNSTERMLENLREVAADKLEKITTIDGETREITADRVKDEIHLCFIDGEHTDNAVFSDFKFCLNVLAKNGGAIVFHDAQITYNGIAECVKYLEENKISFRAYNLPSIVFVIEINDFPLHRNPKILDLLTNNYNGYLESLKYNDTYRKFANRFPFGWMRKLYVKARKQNVCE
jgi:predicted O-methyltransferase YrrM